MVECHICKVRLVEIVRRELKFQAIICDAHSSGLESVEIGVDLAGRRLSSAATKLAEGPFEAVVDVDYSTQRLNGGRVFIKTVGADASLEIAAQRARDDLFSILQVDDIDVARTLVRRRRSRKHGFMMQVAVAYQSYLYGREASRLEAMAFSLCSLGWRAVQREQTFQPEEVEWISRSVDDLIVALRAEPEEYARWTPSLCTMASQLALSRGDADTALRYADAVLAEPDFVERCPITAYNVVLNLCLATYVRYWRDPEDQLDFAMIWETLFKRIVAAMDIRFGTMYEFKVIYDVTFMVARLTLIRREHSDPRLQPVTLDEFIGHVFRVSLNKVQRRRIAGCLGAADDGVGVPPAALVVPA